MFLRDNPMVFHEPAPSATVWRYMDLSRFMSLLEEECLFFTRASLMTDKWEGSLGDISKLPPENQEALRRLHSTDSTYLNCWHVSEYESAAMWDIYQKEGRGVAVQSTWDSVAHSIASSYPIYGGTVEYVDYTARSFDFGNFFEPFMRKRMSFAHENEARLVLWSEAMGGPVEYVDVPGYGGDWRVRADPINPPGYNVAIDLSTLIRAVYVAPDSQQWFSELIAKIVASYGFSFPVIYSSLYDAPII
jgi:hypothetical protein